MSRTDPTGGTTAAGGGARITVHVNGRARDLDAPVALDALVASLTAAPSGVAAALNETVVPRARWSATPLADGDRVEVLTAVQGG
ncbi:MAG: sulfur carrier protein ThiS [Streptomycetaceae bacterium]|nr:sulfur carrier protein ThiS [Streptomycetaceae bacterium]NUS13124.1 sulfur carrier protein ThiS [Streptomyces sp.]